MFAIDFAESFNERKIFSRRNNDALELLDGTFDIEDAILRRSGKVCASLPEELRDAKAIGVG